MCPNACRLLLALKFPRLPEGRTLFRRSGMPGAWFRSRSAVRTGGGDGSVRVMEGTGEASSPSATALPFGIWRVLSVDVKWLIGWPAWVVAAGSVALGPDMAGERCDTTASTSYGHVLVRSIPR
jgi:hypothetical protein